MFLPEYWPAGVNPPVAGTPVTKVFDASKANDELYWKKIYVKRETLVTHPNIKYSGWDGRFVMSGMKQDFNGLPAYSKKLYSYSKSRHLTAVFNLFVFFQIYNMICCRKINDELNFLDGIMSNIYFLVVWVAIVILQVLLISFTGRVFKCHAGGLTWQQWLWTVVPGLFTFFVNLLLKFIPDSICPTLGSEDPDDLTRAEEEYAKLKRNVSVSIRNSGRVKNTNKA